MRRRPLALLARDALASALVLLLAPACGGAAGGFAPGAREAADVQAAGLKKTFAGRSKCDAKSHDRPFVIDWDATDTSSLEAHAKSDVLIVRYDGCEIEVLDRCRIDSTPGANGSYRAPEWTSGSVEVIEIADEGELYAKLPLGVASLGGRVQGGEKFRMEYFVAGTRTATRDRVFRRDLDAIAGCTGATHFVYSYNLGAFSLGAESTLAGDVGVPVGGVSVGARRSRATKAVKSGGDLSTCRTESARQTESCKTPIRLALRAITEGEDPDTTATRMPETPSAKSLAGKLKVERDKEKSAAEHLAQALAKQRARDGRGCLAELDQHDELDPRPSGLSTTPASASSKLRAQCLLLSGQCAAGQSAMRRALQVQMADAGATLQEQAVAQQTAQFCQGADLSNADKLRRAMHDLDAGVNDRKDASYCRERIKTISDLLPRVTSEDDARLKLAKFTRDTSGAACLAKAGACAEAWALFAGSSEEELAAKSPSLTPAQRRLHVEGSRPGFEAAYPQCRGARR